MNLGFSKGVIGLVTLVLSHCSEKTQFRDWMDMLISIGVCHTMMQKPPGDTSNLKSTAKNLV